MPDEGFPFWKVTWRRIYPESHFIGSDWIADVQATEERARRADAYYASIYPQPSRSMPEVNRILKQMYIDPVRAELYSKPRLLFPGGFDG